MRRLQEPRPRVRVDPNEPDGDAQVGEPRAVVGAGHLYVDAVGGEAQFVTEYTSASV